MAKTIQLLANSAKLLNLIAERGPLSIPELAEELDIPRPSIYRLVGALQHVGLASVQDDGATQLGLEVLHLAHATMEHLPEVQAAHSELNRLNRNTGQTVYLCALRGERVVCLDWVRGTRVSLLALSPGGSLPPHAGATSRAILAYSDGLMDHLTAAPLEQFTAKTLTSIDGLERDAREIRQRGYSISDEDVTVGIAALGVPVFGADGQVRCALSVAGLRSEILGREAELVEELQASALQVAQALQVPSAGHPVHLPVGG